jgi:hypothetical protein
MRLRAIFGFLSLLYAVQTQARSPCQEICSQLSKKFEKFKKDIRNLREIEKINLEYLATLDSEQREQRLKATSNLRIAHQRISELKKEKHHIYEQEMEHHCISCKMVIHE